MIFSFSAVHSNDTATVQMLTAYQVSVILESLRLNAAAQERCGLMGAAIDTNAILNNLRECIRIAASMRGVQACPATAAEILMHEQRQSTIHNGG